MIVFQGKEAKVEIILLLESLMRKAGFPSMNKAQQNAIIEHMANLRSRSENLHIQIKIESFPEVERTDFSFSLWFTPTAQEPRSVQ